jgi:hypothetical protein
MRNKLILDITKKGIFTIEARGLKASVSSKNMLLALLDTLTATYDFRYLNTIFTLEELKAIKNL